MHGHQLIQANSMNASMMMTSTSVVPSGILPGGFVTETGFIQEGILPDGFVTDTKLVLQDPRWIEPSRSLVL